MQIDDIYVEYLSCIVYCSDYKIKYYSNLMRVLYDREFDILVKQDSNRVADGLNLRHQFALDRDLREAEYNYIMAKPCSILELMVALAVRCEDQIMHDNRLGDRTGLWFWTMIRNLGLIEYDNGRFDKGEIDDILDTFLARRYQKDGRGGLFYVHGSRRDMRKLEIWYQLMWYLDSIIDAE